MTDDQINAAIADACGWKLQGSQKHQEATKGWQFGHTFAIDPSGKLISRNAIPNYCTDLNAMHEAEKVLKTWDHFVNYHAWLGYCGGNKIVQLHERITATARQRAEAFLRTLGKWEEVQG